MLQNIHGLLYTHLWLKSLAYYMHEQTVYTTGQFVG